MSVTRKYLQIKPNQVILPDKPTDEHLSFYVSESGKLMVNYPEGAEDPSDYLSIGNDGRLKYTF